MPTKVLRRIEYEREGWANEGLILLLTRLHWTEFINRKKLDQNYRSTHIAHSAYLSIDWFIDSIRLT